MSEQDFKIHIVANSIIISKNNESFSVEKNVDGDILFESAIENFETKISFYSRNHEEWQIYVIFESLIKAILGRYILHDDDKNKYSLLPKDFIDLKKKTIIWHSDSGRDNILKLQYVNNEIKISIIRENSQNHIPNRVRIRTSGSNYDFYYQEFEKFFSELYMLVSKKIHKDDGTLDVPVQKKLSIIKND